MDKLCVVFGSTATGKTDLALDLAKKYRGELISCDSRQVYQGLDIGTGKVPNNKFQITKGEGFWEIGGIWVWMYDVVSPNSQYSVADYVKQAGEVVGEISRRGNLPIIVGGTGLYLKALLEGLSNLSISVDLDLRKELENLDLKGLEEKLQKLSPTRWTQLNFSDRQNKRRLIRAIEIISLNADRDEERKKKGLLKDYKVLKIGLTAPREILYKRVDQRVVDRINQGMVQEAESLSISGITYSRMRQLGLEYGVLADYLEGEIQTIEGDQGLIKIMQGKIHGFVRRQLTWFKKEKDVHWFDISKKDYQEKIANLVAKWYDGTD